MLLCWKFKRKIIISRVPKPYLSLYSKKNHDLKEKQQKISPRCIFNQFLFVRYSVFCRCFTFLCFPLTVLLSVCPPRGANPLDHRDNSFSRSRSSSVTSIDKEAREAVSSFHFCESFARKGDSSLTPCLYVGTSLGTVLVLALSLPPAGEQRQLQPVIISPTGGLTDFQDLRSVVGPRGFCFNTSDTNY